MDNLKTLNKKNNLKKCIVLTGGASGMGRASALKLADNGYYVYSLDIKASGEKNDNICELIVDVTNQESITKAYNVISSECTEIFAIINFAGIIMMNSLVEISEEDFKRIFDINFFGVYRINKTFFPLLVKGKSKIIITTSELAPNKIIPFNSIYSISKKALDAYAEGLRMELGLFDIQVITLRPGAVKTGLINQSNNAFEKLSNSTKLYKENTKRFQKIMDSEQGASISPEKIAELVLKIMNKKRSKLIYTKNASLKLKLLNLVPSRLQIKLYKKLLN